MEHLAASLTQAIYRRGWSTKKKQRAIQISKTSADTLEGREELEELEKAEAWKLQSEELIEKGFGYGRESTDAKTLLQSAQATKTLIDIYKTAGSMLAPAAKQQETVGLMLFVIDPDKPSVKRAQVIDLEDDTEDIGL